MRVPCGTRVAVSAGALLAMCAAAAAGTVSMPGSGGSLTIDTDNFATTVVDSSLSSTSLTFGSGIGVDLGPFTTAESIPFVTGYDLSRGLGLGAGPTGGQADYVVPGFALVSIINGSGYDLAIWEAGTPAENVLVSLSTDGGSTFSTSISYSTATATPSNSDSGYTTNIGLIDFDDFGIGAGVQIDAVRISGLFTGIGGSGPDILAVAALNAGTPTGNIPPVVPLPPAAWLGVVLLGGLGLARRVRGRSN